VFVLGRLIYTLANLIELALNAYLLIVIARAVLSWVNPDPYNPIVRFIHRVTEPVLRPIRDRLPTVAMGLDLSPMVVLLAIYFLKSFLVGSLHDLATSLR
jgi:YggT family protein